MSVRRLHHRPTHDGTFTIAVGWRGARRGVRLQQRGGDGAIALAVGGKVHRCAGAAAAPRLRGARRRAYSRQATRPGPVGDGPDGPQAAGTGSEELYRWQMQIEHPMPDCHPHVPNALQASLAATGLSHAAGDSSPREEVIKTLLRAGADPKSSHGEAALRNAARDGHAACMSLLLNVSAEICAEICAEISSGETPEKDRARRALSSHGKSSTPP